MRKFIFFLLLMFELPLYSQNIISGLVYDRNDSTAIAGAVVDCLLEEDSTSLNKSISDANGKFKIAQNTSKSVILKITHIGYLPYFLSISETKNTTIDVGKIFLSQQNTELKEVTISANRNQIDRIFVVPSKNDIKVSEDIYGLLMVMKLRNMRIDILNKTVKIGGQKPLWKINGVPKDQSEITNISPQDVLRIDYSDVASIRERDAGYGGVINIILKKKEDGGSITANVMSAATTGFINGGVQMGYHKGKEDFTISYSTSYRRYHKWTKDVNSLFITPTDTIIRNIHGIESRFGYLSQNINIGYTHSFNETSSFSMTIRNPLYYQHDKPNSMLQNGVYRKVNSSFQGYTPSIDIFYGKRFRNDDRMEVNLVGTYGFKGKSVYTMKDFQGANILGIYDMPADTKRRSLIGELFYLHNIGSNRLKIGVQSLYGKNTNTYYVPNNFKDGLSENNLFSYAQWDGGIGKFQYSISTGLKYNKMDNGTIRKYWNNQSQLVLSYTPNSNIFFRYYTMFYPTMPSLYALTTVAQQIDDLQLMTGNPDLKPTHNLYNGFLFSYSKGRFNSDFQITYNFASRPIFMHINYDNLKQLFVQSYINGIHNYRLDFNYSPSIKDIWGFINLLGEIGYSHYGAKTEDVSHSLNNIYWNVTLQMYYKQFTLSTYFMQPSKALLNEIISRDEKVSRIMLTWKKHDFSITAALFNPFTPSGSNYIDESLSKYNPNKSKVSIHDNGNMFTLGITWNLNFGKKVQRAERNLNNSDTNSSILRAPL
ncbi:carboxypeptidase-like regulatory domain-containing protein [Prevotella cerevisiae]|uniref:Carboxypeptidase-like regulatory domain-containing protein n=1 Tax=Segatella cerevisiae TaxID=2053716 RepID=A0ABT1BV17_9BACT|nr:carboxypeptidase-like regulatory domain-containing protein [Segatella cerevisiae]MCO6024931.1 carboxypeptidase-like regulatory domain-containing protein [Segatella cerevisiae]